MDALEFEPMIGYRHESFDGIVVRIDLKLDERALALILQERKQKSSQRVNCTMVFVYTEPSHHEIMHNLKSLATRLRGLQPGPISASSAPHKATHRFPLSIATLYDRYCFSQLD